MVSRERAPLLEPNLVRSLPVARTRRTLTKVDVGIPLPGICRLGNVGWGAACYNPGPTAAPETRPDTRWPRVRISIPASILLP